MTHQYKISCLKENLKDLRHFTHDVLTSYSIDEKKIHEVILSVDEVCANIIIHSNTKNKIENSYIKIDIQYIEHNLLIEITDPFQHDFDLNQHNSLSIKELVLQKKKGGLGIKIIKKYLDKIEVIKKENHTLYKLHKSC